jgi:hypothetical protein
MKRVFIILCVAVSFLRAEIIESSKLSDMEKYRGEGVLFLYDIDNTLVRPVQTLGSDQWFNYRLKSNREQMEDKQEALEKTLVEWASIQSISKVQALDEGAQASIKRMQDSGAMMMGFTTRGVRMSSVTPYQLKQLGIDFSETALISHDHFFISGQSIVFRKGVLFTAATHKGRTLFTFLNNLNVKPSKVVFINDKFDNLSQVAETCKKKNIPFVGLRYDGSDEWVKTFNSQAVDVQLERYSSILSDAEAKALVK